MVETISKRFIEERLKTQNPWWETKNVPPELIGKSRNIDFSEMVREREIKVLFGVRRSGKSTLLFQIMNYLIKGGEEPKNIFLLNFDFERFERVSLDEIFKVYLELTEASPKNVYLFLDEVHFREDWIRFVRRLYDMKEVKRIFVTDSSSRLLKGEYARILTGRTIKYEIFPLSFKEFLSFKGFSFDPKLISYKTEARIKSFLKEYMEFGGFPEVVLKSGAMKYRILQEYFSDIIYKDIGERFRLDTRNVYNVAKFLITNIAKYVSLRSIRRNFNVGLGTASKILTALEEVRLVHFLNPFSFSLKEQVRGMKKIYVVDSGLANAVGFRFSENFGKLIENVVFLHLRRMQSQNPLLEIYYWRNYLGNEVDFVIKEGTKVKELIQVCWDVEDEETRKREIRSLLKAMEKFKLKEGLIITEDYEDEEKVDGKTIKYIPLWKLLLAYK